MVGRDEIVQSFLTRFLDSAEPTVAWILSLLFCLACAKPFPLDDLEEGMSAATAWTKFGEPRAIEADPDGFEASWTYGHEEQAWFVTVMSSTVFLPHCVVATAVTLPFGAEHWCAIIPTVEEGSVVLHFEGEKLVRWDVTEPSLPVVSSSYYDPVFDEFQRQQQQWHQEMIDRAIDIKHHKKGHTHHHGHD